MNWDRGVQRRIREWRRDRFKPKLECPLANTRFVLRQGEMSGETVLLPGYAGDVVSVLLLPLPVDKYAGVETATQIFEPISTPLPLLGILRGIVCGPLHKPLGR